MSAAGYVSSSTLGGNATSTSGIAITPVAGNDVIALLLTYSATVPTPTVSSTVVGQAVITDVPFSIDPLSGVGFAVYRVHNAAAVSQSIVASFGSTKVVFRVWLIQASGIGSFDTSQSTVEDGNSNELEVNALTPSVAGALLLVFGGANHFVASQGGWTGFTSLTPFISGPTGLAGYLSQVTPGALSPTNTVGSQVDWAALIVSYTPSAAPGAVLAGTAQAAAVGVGALSTGIKLAAAAADASTASGVMAGYLLPAAMQDPSAATGALTTAMKLAAAASDSSAFSAALTNWASVTLTGTLYAASGSIVDPNGPWTNGAPAAGDIVYYDGTYLIIETDGEIVATTNDPNGSGLGFSALAQWDNAGTWSQLVIVVTPWSIAAATATSNALGSLSTAIELVAQAQALCNATAQLATGGGGSLASTAADSSAAAGTISTGIQLASAVQTTSSAVASLATAIELAANALDDALAGAALSDKALIASASDTSVGSAVLSTQIQMLAAVVSVANAVGALATRIQMAAVVQTATSAAGSLKSGIELDANAIAQATGAANLTVTVPLSGAGTSATVAVATILTGIHALASATGATAAHGSLSTLIKLLATVQSSSAAAGSMLTGISMISHAQASSAAIAALTTQARQQIAAAALLSSSVSGALATRQSVAGAAADTSAAAGSLRTGVQLAADAADTSSGSADLFTVIDPDAAATAETNLQGSLGGAGSTLFTADVLVEIEPGGVDTLYSTDPIGRFMQRVGDRLLYAIDWTGWLAAYWKPNVVVAIGDVVRPWPPNGFQLRCFSPGATGNAPPAWPPFLGAAVLDGEAEWQVQPLDNTSLSASLVSASWSAPQGIVLTNQRTAGLIAFVTIDSSQASPYTNYDVLCLAGASDARKRVGKLSIQVTGGVPN